MNIEAIKAKIAGLDNVARVVEVVALHSGEFLYLVETCLNFPKFVVGIVDETGFTDQLLGCGLEETGWNGFNEELAKHAVIEPEDCHALLQKRLSSTPFTPDEVERAKESTAEYERHIAENRPVAEMTPIPGGYQDRRYRYYPLPNGSHRRVLRKPFTEAQRVIAQESSASSSSSAIRSLSSSASFKAASALSSTPASSS